MNKPKSICKLALRCLNEPRPVRDLRVNKRPNRGTDAQRERARLLLELLKGKEQLKRDCNARCEFARLLLEQVQGRSTAPAKRQNPRGPRHRHPVPGLAPGSGFYFGGPLRLSAPSPGFSSVFFLTASERSSGQIVQ
jgi:hypothetical protein